MSSHTFRVAAGSISSLLFMASALPMLFKAWKTRDLRSYSPANLLIANVGNLIYWFYVSGLPEGPVWLVHAFSTLTAFLMLVWYIRYRGSLHGEQPTARDPHPDVQAGATRTTQLGTEL